MIRRSNFSPLRDSMTAPLPSWNMALLTSLKISWILVSSNSFLFNLSVIRFISSMVYPGRWIALTPYLLALNDSYDPVGRIIDTLYPCLARSIAALKKILGTLVMCTTFIRIFFWLLSSLESSVLASARQRKIPNNLKSYIITIKIALALYH